MTMFALGLLVGLVVGASVAMLAMALAMMAKNRKSGE